MREGAMRSAIRTTFPHRHNADGTFDSICPTCFATVGTNRNEAILRLHELAHDCNPVEVYRVSQWSFQNAPVRRLD
jgi:hypothetical protein